LAAATNSARSASDVAVNQYTTGLIGFSDVLDAQRSLLSFEDQLAQSRGSILSNLVRLYKALGGGWQSFEQPSFSISPKDKG
jgi:outer membrane protein TolC